MKKKSEHKITKDSLKVLRGNSAHERILHRLHSVALVLKGDSSSKAARIYGDSPRAVAYWVTRFKQKGLEGLRDEARSGKPSKLNATQIRKMQIFVKESKNKSKPVNAKILSQYILKQFKVSLTTVQCWRILNRLAT